MQEKPKDVLELIRSTPLSEKKRQTAKYILDNSTEAAFLTAAELARRASVSEPTVIRLATDLGFSGYPELQAALQDKLQVRLTTVHRLEGSHRYANSKSPVIQSLLTDMTNFEATLEGLNAKTVQKVLNRLQNADKVIILGYKMSACLAHFFQMALKKTIDNTVAVTSATGAFQEELAYATNRSVVVAISFPRYTNAVVNDFRLAHKKPITTVAITDSVLSPLVEFADYYLLARCKAISYIDAFAAPLSMLCAISTALSIRKENESLARLQEMETLWEEGEIFF